jgi:hypothetical protein
MLRKDMALGSYSFDAPEHLGEQDLRSVFELVGYRVRKVRSTGSGLEVTAAGPGGARDPVVMEAESAGFSFRGYEQLADDPGRVH